MQNPLESRVYLGVMREGNEVKLYAALHDDIAEGFVWLKKDGLLPRSIVKITHTENGRHIYCEALQFETNFLNIYNRAERRYHIPKDNLESSMVMSHWYRAKLGSGEALKTQADYQLGIAAANGWSGKLRASMNHPQVGVRVGVHLALWLGLLSLALGVVGVRRDIVGLVRWATRTTKISRNAIASAPLSVDGVLAWRDTYGDLLGKPREAVIERFGTPQEQAGVILKWRAAPKTTNRSLTVVFDSALKNSSVNAVSVFAGPTESLDSIEVLKKAPLFDFRTGTGTDSVLSYFAATTKDGRNAFLFDVAEGGLKFRGAVFADTGKLSDNK